MYLVHLSRASFEITLRFCYTGLFGALGARFWTGIAQMWGKEMFYFVARLLLLACDNSDKVIFRTSVLLVSICVRKSNIA
jgi:hypothetical protein